MTGSNAGADKRTAIFRRDGFRCVYCANVFFHEQLTIDHVQPLVKQGDHSTGNLVTAGDLFDLIHCLLTDSPFRVVDHTQE